MCRRPSDRATEQWFPFYCDETTGVNFLPFARVLVLSRARFKSAQNSSATIAASFASANQKERSRPNQTMPFVPNNTGDAARADMVFDPNAGGWVPSDNGMNWSGPGNPSQNANLRAAPTPQKLIAQVPFQY